MALSFLKKKLDQGLNLASKAYDQVNPFDDGRSWSTRNPTQTRSVFTQAKEQTRDIFDANTKRDQQKRVAQGRAADYRQSQQQSGQRAYTNPVESVFRNAVVDPVVRGVNTIGGASAELGTSIYDAARLGRESIQGTDYSYASLQDRIAKERAKRNYFGRDGGILNLGTNFDNRRQLSDPKKFYGGVLQTGADVAGVIPAGKGVQAGYKVGSKVLSRPTIKLAGTGAAENIISDTGQQLKDTGRIDPKQTIIAGTIGGALPIATTAGGRVIRRSGDFGTTVKKSDVFEPSNRPRLSGDDRVKLQNYTDALDPVSRNQLSGSDLNKIIREAREAAQKHGISLDGPRAEQLNRINQFLVDVEAPGQRGGADPFQDLAKKVGKDKVTLKEDGSKKSVKLKDEVIEDIVEEPPAKPVEEVVAVNRAVEPEDSILDPASAADLRAQTKSTPEPLGDNNLRMTEKLSPDRQIRKATNAAEEAINKKILAASISKNPIARGVARLSQGVSRELGSTEAIKQARREMRGTSEIGKVRGGDMAKLGDSLTKESKERIWASIDKEQAGRLGKTVDEKDLTPSEKDFRDLVINKTQEITDGNLKRGLITPEQAANEQYLTRKYKVFEESSPSKIEKATRQNLLKQYTGRKEVSDQLLDQAITDPAYLAGKKIAQSHQAWAINDYANFLDSSGVTSSTPGKGMVQLPDNPLYGSASGKYVPKNISDDFTGFQYTNATLNAFNDIISAYDSLKIRRAKKQILTVFNPAVRLGNQISNRIFATLNGLNPIEFELAMRKTKKMTKNRDPMYTEAVERGLTQSDITQADFTKQISDYIDDPEILKNSTNWFQRTYSEADDRAKLAAYTIHRKKGYSPDEAAKLTQRGFQDYGSVGFMFDMAAKTPVIGNAFVRFAGDSIRLGKNALVDHPLRTASLVATYATFNTAMSRMSGETEEDRQTREDRFGAPKVPFTDISLTTQTPWGEVNVARFIPFYHLNDTGSELARFSPIQGNPTKPENFDDPLLGMIGQVIADKDFRGKSIQDPENRGQFTEELSDEDRRNNLVRFLATQNIPLGRETDSLIAAAKGEEDVYGKKRDLKQAALRAAGVKVEQFGPEEAQQQRDVNKYFDDKEELDAVVAELPQGQQEAFKRLTGYYKTREQVPNEFDPGSTRYKKDAVYKFPEDKWKDYTSNPELYDIIKAQKESKQAEQGAPLQPEFDDRLSPQFRAQLINNKSLAPGENVEAQERMYSDPEWDTYQDLREEYKEKASQYYPENDGEFVDELVNHVQADFPEKGPAKKAYDAAFTAYEEGEGEKPEFTDQVKAERDQYNEAKRQWTNKEREARGLPPIAKDTWDNITFGFTNFEDRDSSSSGRSSGSRSSRGGSRGGSRRSSAGLNPYRFKVSLNAGGSVYKPSIRKRRASKSKINNRKQKPGSKPKVSIKKSKV